LHGQRRIGLGEFFKGEAWDFRHHIVDGRLKTGRCFARDVIFDFVEQITDRELGGNLRDGKPRWT